MTEQFYSVTFLPTLEIDQDATSSTILAEANELLSPTIALLKAISGDNSFDIWKFFNWLVVSYYWITLADFGQIAPTMYKWNEEGLPIFSQPIRYNATNNIFVNNDLFTLYANYFADTIFPVLHQFDPNATLPKFLDLTPNNALQQQPMTFIRSYSCTRRQLKGWLSATISVIVADYTFIMGMYSFIVWVTARGYHRRHGNQESTSHDDY